MYKTVKIPEEAYEEAKLLSIELEKSKTITGVFNVNLSTAISYAITKMLENVRKKRSNKMIIEPVDEDIGKLFKEARSTTPKHNFTAEQMDKLTEDGILRQ